MYDSMVPFPGRPFSFDEEPAGSTGEADPQKEAIDLLSRQVQGQEKLMGGFKQEIGDVRQLMESINQKLTEPAAPLVDEYLTVQQAQEREQGLVSTITDILRAAGTESTIKNTYGVSDDELRDVKEFAKANGIDDLETAWFKKSVSEGKLQLDTTSGTFKQITEDNKNGNSDKVPKASSSNADDAVTKKIQAMVKDPNRHEELMEFFEKNPNAEAQYLRRADSS